MRKKRHLIKKAVALAAMGTILVAGNVSAARQNTKHFDRDINLTCRKLCQGTVGSDANIATQKITSRVLQFMDAKYYCDVFFVHRKGTKYVTIGVWFRDLLGECRSKYMTSAKVRPGDTLITESNTMKNPYSGATTTSIAGTVKY